MDALPPEVLLQIVDLACCDVGQTACSLRLVSRYLCAATDPYRFRFIAVLGAKRMNRLFVALSSAPEVKRTVRHLFVSDKPAETRYGRVYVNRAAPNDVDEVRKAQELSGFRFVRSAKDVLPLVAPSIETLTCLVHNPFGQSDLLTTLLTTEFPKLTHLTLRLGDMRFPSLQRLPPDLSPSMPNLTHLHILCSWKPSCAVIVEVGSIFASSNVTSNLSHIRFSGIQFTPLCPETLQLFMTPSSSDHAPLLPAVAELIIEPVPLDRGLQQTGLMGNILDMICRIHEEGIVKGKMKFRVLSTTLLRTSGVSKQRWLMVQSGNLPVSDDWS
ncbi:hypothetical protein NEOLEDRAFT_815139 [Neolentinus lepideus HHB14362 ss-1]|uniref:F-box domain-containing protein n=1 Tax=Neolentinus lepideus HHB14362 ss-1 TaxID=1314782 RepID=A0A165PCN1_9AGAM|nr:hypothetical protein NEOLEDRAFT_815139 [Neolentinus lepideus HHB14362 ss-1]